MKYQLLVNVEKAMSRYNRTIQSVAGCGSRGQSYVDSEYKNWKLEFDKLTEEEKERCPYKPPNSPYQIRDDETYGAASGFGSLASSYRRW